MSNCEEVNFNWQLVFGTQRYLAHSAVTEVVNQAGIRPAIDLVEKWEMEKTVAPGLGIVLTLLN